MSANSDHTVLIKLRHQRALSATCAEVVFHVAGVLHFISSNKERMNDSAIALMGAAAPLGILLVLYFARNYCAFIAVLATGFHAFATTLGALASLPNQNLFMLFAAIAALISLYQAERGWHLRRTARS